MIILQHCILLANTAIKAVSPQLLKLHNGVGASRNLDYGLRSAFGQFEGLRRHFIRSFETVAGFEIGTGQYL